MDAKDRRKHYGSRASARKNDFYYIVLSYKDADGKRKTKWEATGLSVKRNKKKAEALLLERRRNFVVPTAPAEIRLDDDILFRTSC